jgi:hypothetical protein
MPIIAASIAAPSRKFGFQFIFELTSIISNKVLRYLLARSPLFCDFFDFYRIIVVAII